LATARLDAVFQHLRRVVMLRDGAGMTDGQLLEAFISQRNEVAFEALVRRHGPMVLKVCRRALRNHHDAEDAFQATFLVLARKASSVRPRDMVANWLYGVAYRTALKARTLRAKAQAREMHVGELPEPAHAHQGRCHDLQEVLDQELTHLGDTYRLPIILCDLEGKSIKKTAEQLGWPQGTVAGRLARGRKMLAKRLARHGLGMGGGVALLANSASACVPPGLVAATVKAVGACAAGQAVATGVVSANVAILMEGAIKAMFLTKLKTVVVVLLVAATAGIGGGIYSRSMTATAQTVEERRGDQPQPREAGDHWKTDSWIVSDKGEVSEKLGDERFSLTLYHGRTRLMLLKETPTRVQIGGDEKIVDFTLLGREKKELSLSGKALGTTVLNLWFTNHEDKTHDFIISYLVRVLPDPEEKTRLDQSRGAQNAETKQDDLVIDKACFCENITSFGIYEPLPEGHVFRVSKSGEPGERVLLYAELRNFASELKNGFYVTRVASLLEIRDPKGVLVWSSSFGDETPMRSRTILHDFHKEYKFYLPPNLAAGTYTLVIQVTDQTRPEQPRVASKTLEFRVGAATVSGPNPQAPKPVVPTVSPPVKLDNKPGNAAKSKEKSPGTVGQIITVGCDPIAAALIRQEVLRMYPGQVFDAGALRKAEKRLSELNEEFTATITLIGGEDKEVKDILVTVKEKQLPSAKNIEDDFYVKLSRCHLDLKEANYEIWVREVKGRRLIRPILVRRDSQGQGDFLAIGDEAELKVDLEKGILLLIMSKVVIISLDGDRSTMEARSWSIPLASIEGARPFPPPER
jgi:RNA polymerase sigma factor (sigma-70 family)